MGLAVQNTVPRNSGELEKRDWELVSLALILFTAFAGGLILFVYSKGLVQAASSPTEERVVGLLFLGLIALVLLLNIYVIDKRRLIAKRTLPSKLDEFKKGDWDLWVFILTLLTGFASGVIVFVYADQLVQATSSVRGGFFLGLLLFGLIGLVLLVNIYLIEKRRSVHQLRYKLNAV